MGKSLVMQYGNRRQWLYLVLVTLALLAVPTTYYFAFVVPQRLALEQAAIKALRSKNLLVLTMPGSSRARVANLMNEQVDADIMRSVGDLNCLEQLILNRSTLTDDELKPVSRLTRLISLSAGYNQLTAEGVRNLGGLNNLQTLLLPENPIGDEGMETISRLTQLKILDLSNCGLTDTSVAALEELDDVKHLLLAGNAITDAAIEHLIEMDALSRVDLGDTDVSLEGMRRLRDAFPSITIDVASRIPDDSTEQEDSHESTPISDREMPNEDQNSETRSDE